MKEIIALILIAGILTLLLVFSIIMLVVKRNLFFKRLTIFILCVFTFSLPYVGYVIVSKSYHKASTLLSPRSGEEIYKAIFDHNADCLKILDSKDQLIPGLDDAIWLYFETCPAEVSKLISQESYTFEKININDLIDKAEDKQFDINLLNSDSILYFRFDSPTEDRIQTFWVNPDSTKVIYRDSVY